MSKELCIIHARNKELSSVVVATAILPPRTVRAGYTAIRLMTEKHVQSAYNAEKKNLIEIRGGIPAEVLEETAFYQKLANVAPAKEDANNTPPAETKKADTPPAAPPVETDSKEDADSAKLTEEAITSMSAKELKAHISKHDLDIVGYSSMSAKEVKNAVLVYFGFEPIEE